MSEGWEGKHKVKLHSRMDHLMQEVAFFENLLLSEMWTRWKIQALEQEEHIVAEKIGLLKGRLRAVKEQVEGLEKERRKIAGKRIDRVASIQVDVNRIMARFAKMRGAPDEMMRIARRAMKSVIRKSSIKLFFYWNGMYSTRCPLWCESNSPRKFALHLTAPTTMYTENNVLKAVVAEPPLGQLHIGIEEKDDSPSPPPRPANLAVQRRGQRLQPVRERKESEPEPNLGSAERPAVQSELNEVFDALRAGGPGNGIGGLVNWYLRHCCGVRIDADGRQLAPRHVVSFSDARVPQRAASGVFEKRVVIDGGITRKEGLRRITWWGIEDGVKVLLNQYQLAVPLNKEHAPETGPGSLIEVEVTRACRDGFILSKPVGPWVRYVESNHDPDQSTALNLARSDRKENARNSLMQHVKEADPDGVGRTIDVRKGRSDEWLCNFDGDEQRCKCLEMIHVIVGDRVKGIFLVELKDAPNANGRPSGHLFWRKGLYHWRAAGRELERVRWCRCTTYELEEYLDAVESQLRR